MDRDKLAERIEFLNRIEILNPDVSIVGNIFEGLEEDGED